MNELRNTTSVPTIANQQHDYILLDGSSSMSTRWQDSLKAIDAYVASLRDAQVNTTVHLAVFSTGGYNYDTQGGTLHYDAQPPTPPSAWTPCNPYFPHGGTPLYDAINAMGRAVRDLKPSKCSILIVTDGEEFDSKTTVHQARAILDWLRAQGFQVTFLGCDFDNTKEARMLGANEANSIGTSAKRLADATKELARKRANYSAYGTPMDFTDDERTRFGGYLSDHTNGN